MTRYAEARGGALFAVAGVLMGVSASDPVERAGAGWALVDLSRHLSDPAAAGRAQAMATPLLTGATAVRWSRAARPLGALAHIARMDLAIALDRALPTGAPGRVGRLLLHRIWGR